ERRIGVDRASDHGDRRLRSVRCQTVVPRCLAAGPRDPLVQPASVAPPGAVPTGDGRLGRLRFLLGRTFDGLDFLLVAWLDHSVCHRYAPLRASPPFAWPFIEPAAAERLSASLTTCRENAAPLSARM